jgi:hypothetical protein
MSENFLNRRALMDFGKNEGQIREKRERKKALAKV